MCVCVCVYYYCFCCYCCYYCCCCCCCCLLLGVVVTVAGGGAVPSSNVNVYFDGIGSYATFMKPTAIAIDRSGQLFVMDSGVIRRIVVSGK